MEWSALVRPGEPVPSAAALARATGFSVLTCRKALWTLIKDGELVPGHSRSGRPRVPVKTSTSAERTLADAARTLSGALAVRRRALGLTQPQLAAAIGISVTTVGHAETGRLWQSRHFWERADKVLDANGDLLALHDAYRAAGVTPTATADVANHSAATKTLVSVPTANRVTVTWSDGTVTTVESPKPNNAGMARVGAAEDHGTSRDGAPRP